MTNRTVLVTGGTSLLGEAIASVVADIGADVVVTSRDQEKAARLAERYNQEVDREACYPLELDLQDRDSIAGAVAVLAETDLLPTSLVCNASNREAIDPPFEALTHEEFTDLFEVDVAGHLLLARRVRETADGALGSLTFLSSIYVHQGVDDDIYPPEMDLSPIHYAAVKAAFEGVVRNLVACWAPATRVNAVVAGGVRAPETQPPEFVDNYSEKTMLDRMVTPEEVADAVAFLTSERASYITAESFYVDGGYRSW